MGNIICANFTHIKISTKLTPSINYFLILNIYNTIDIIAVICAPRIKGEFAASFVIYHSLDMNNVKYFDPLFKSVLQFVVIVYISMVYIIRDLLVTTLISVRQLLII